MSTKLKSVLLLGIPVTLAILLSVVLQATILTHQEEFNQWLGRFGPYIILVYIPLQTLTIIVAPIGGFFHQVAILALLPPLYAWLLIYLTTTPIYMVNFFLARRYGRPLVQKIVGKAALEKIDHLAKDVGTSTIIVLKLFQGNLFDYLSYAIGLTQIPLRTFTVINIFGGIPGTVISYFIFTRFENFTLAVIALTITSYVLIGISLIINHVLKRHKKI